MSGLRLRRRWPRSRRMPPQVFGAGPRTPTSVSPADPRIERARPGKGFQVDPYTRRNPDTYPAYMSEPRSEQHGNPSSKPKTGPRTNGGPEAGGATDQAHFPLQPGPGSEQGGAADPDPSAQPTDTAEREYAGEAELPAPHIDLPVGETKSSWREHALTRIEELDDYVDQLVADQEIASRAATRARMHLEARRPRPRTRRATRMGARFANSVHIERVMTHIDAAEAFILRAAPLDHVAAQLPAISGPRPKSSRQGQRPT